MYQKEMYVQDVQQKIIWNFQHLKTYIQENGFEGSLTNISGETGISRKKYKQILNI